MKKETKNHRKIGVEKENLACAYLRRQGYCVLKQNYTSRFGEIDVVAKDGNYLCFVEVKYRKSQKSGHPLEAITLEKQRKIRQTSLWYLAEHSISPDTPLRYDVVGICAEEIVLIKNAF